MSERAASPFSRAGLLALIVVGFGVFLAILYLIAMGDPWAPDNNNGRAHSASKGLNGFSALVELVEADGFEVTRSRETRGLETNDLLVLTPPHYMDPEELTAIIDRREYLGPTLVILPKWDALPSRFFTRSIEPETVKDGWVLISGFSSPNWAEEEEGLLAIDLKRGGTKEQSDEDDGIADPLLELDGRGERGARSAQRPDLTDDPQSFSTLYPLDEVSGSLPTSVGFYAEASANRKPVVLDQAGRMIAFSYEQDSYYEDPDDRLSDEYEPSNWVVFVVEPDLMNNWGLADRTRATAALSLVRNMDWGEFDGVVFDLTLNGFGGAMNLLTLAFQPPFVAATICLVLAMLIVGWRGFLRFGPAASRERETAFGKARLVANGADLILRAGRLPLLVEPYIALSAKRIARSLGLAKPETDAINAALAVRHPHEPSFTQRCNELRTASTPGDILRAARALSDQALRPSGENRESHQE